MVTLHLSLLAFGKPTTVRQIEVVNFLYLCKNGVIEDKPTEGADVEFPFSHDEHAAMARYLSNLRKQLQDVSDLFTSRYGKTSNVAELAVKALVAATLLEHELMLLDEHEGAGQMEAVEQAAAGSK